MAPLKFGGDLPSAIPLEPLNRQTQKYTKSSQVDHGVELLTFVPPQCICPCSRHLPAQAKA